MNQTESSPTRELTVSFELLQARAKKTGNAALISYFEAVKEVSIASGSDVDKEMIMPAVRAVYLSIDKATDEDIASNRLFFFLNLNNKLVRMLLVEIRQAIIKGSVDEFNIRRKVLMICLTKAINHYEDHFV